MFIIFIGWLLYLAVTFFINAGIVALLCWGLNALGIHTILGWTVAFSWPLVFVFIIISIILRCIFHRN